MRTESCSLFAGNNLLTLSMVLASPQKLSTEGTSRPPCGRSFECRQLSVTVAVIVPTRKNSEQTAETFLGTWPTNKLPSFLYRHCVGIM